MPSIIYSIRKNRLSRALLKGMELDAENDRLYLTIQYSNKDHLDIPTFYLSEFIVYAINPDTGEETDLLYATLGDYPQPVPAYQEDYPASVFNFPLVLILSDEINVSISAPAGLVTYDELTEMIRQVDITVPVAGWEENTDTGNIYGYYCDVDVDGIKTRMVPQITVLPDSFETAWSCDLACFAQTVLGAVRVYAKSVPADDINASLLLLANPPYVRNATSGGDEVQAGVGLSMLNGRLSVNLGDGISVDNSNNLTVDRVTVLTDSDMLDEDETERDLENILLNQ